MSKENPKSTSGLSMRGFLTVIAVVLVATGVLATAAMAGSGDVKKATCSAVCAQVDVAECVWVQQHTAPTTKLGVLVTAGILRHLPQCPAGGRIVVRVTADGGFTIFCSEHGVMRVRASH